MCCSSKHFPTSDLFIEPLNGTCAPLGRSNALRLSSSVQLCSLAKILRSQIASRDAFVGVGFRWKHEVSLTCWTLWFWIRGLDTKLTNLPKPKLLAEITSFNLRIGFRPEVLAQPCFSGYNIFWCLTWNPLALSKKICCLRQPRHLSYVWCGYYYFMYLRAGYSSRLNKSGATLSSVFKNILLLLKIQKENAKKLGLSFILSFSPFNLCKGVTIYFGIHQWDYVCFFFN